MDIKKEPEEVVDPVSESDTSFDSQWRKYKEELDNDTFLMKTDLDLGECSYSYSEGKLTLQDVPVDFENIDTEIDMQWRKNISEKPNASKHIYSKKSQASQITFPNDLNMLHVDEENNEKHVKKRHIGCNNPNTSDTVRYGSFRVFSELPGVRKLPKDPFYERNLVCNICYVVFATSDERKLHELIHKQFICDNRTLSEQSELGMTSNKINHSPIELFIPIEPARNSHRSAYSLKNTYKCDECDYFCKRADIFKAHKMIHSGEKPFKCDHCDYMCTRADRLKAHKRIHSDEKLFKCEECDYSCNYSGNLKLHKMTHSNEKPFKCGECGYSCKRLDRLKVHKMMHTGEKPFKCKKCDFSCTQSCHLKLHKMSHSG